MEGSTCAFSRLKSGVHQVGINSKRLNKTVLAPSNNDDCNNVRVFSSNARHCPRAAVHVGHSHEGTRITQVDANLA